MRNRESDDKAVWVLIAVLTLALYSALLWRLRYLPFAELPHHLVRASIIGDFLYGGGAENFVFRPALVPGLLGDMLLAGLRRVLPLHTSGLLWMNMLLVIFPLAVLFYFEQRGEDRRMLLLVALVSPFLATNYFFLSGSVHFYLGIAFAFISLGLWEAFVRSEQRYAALRAVTYLVFVVAMFATYLISFGSAFFLCLVLLIHSFYRFLCQRISFAGLLASVLPHLLLAIAYITEGFSPSALGDWRRRAVAEKVISLASMFVRYDLKTDAYLLLFLFGVVLLSVVVGMRHRTARHPSGMFELALSATGLFVAYLVLPSNLEGNAPVDTLCLPFLIVFAVGFMFNWVPSTALEAVFLRGSCAALSILNLVYLAVHLVPLNIYAADYQDALLRIPDGKVVLPVLTRAPNGRLLSNLHGAEFYMPLRRGIVPTFFDEQSVSARLGYFQYRRSFYLPSPFWYLRRESVDWRRIRDEYEYLIIEKPFEPARFREIERNLVFENDAASVFEIPHKR